MKSVTETYRGIGTVDGKVVQYTMNGDRHYLKYRSDLFFNPDMQAKFKAATGWDLTVPATWEKVNEVAAVFNNFELDGDGAPNFGTAEVTKRDDLMFSAFISRVAPHTKHPDVKGGFFFDLETMTPLVNTPGWMRGLDLFCHRPSLDAAFYQTEMGWDANVATTYADKLKAVDTAPNQVLDLRVPGVGEFMSALAACGTMCAIDRRCCD